MASRLPHFEVDKKGLALLLERRGKAFVITELLSNAWDEQVSHVDIAFEWLGSGKAKVSVEDDSPEGFADLRDAFTLFAPSRKKINAEQRGRFNLGEKLVVAACETASVATTTGTIVWTPEGRAKVAKKREKGSLFTGVLRMTKAEYDEAVAVIHTLIPPHGITTSFNFHDLPVREPVLIFEATLRTEIADADGRLKPTTRKTKVELHKPLKGETPTLYEMGIPVVAMGDLFHVNVQQKVPLNSDRDNVTPAFLRDVRTTVLNHAYTLMSPASFEAGWVVDALQDPNVNPEAVKAAVKGRFGEKAVAYDPSDPEANKIAMSQGYTVIPGGALPKAAWAQIKKTGAALPSGKVTPSPKAYAENGPELKLMERDHWPEAVLNVATFAEALGMELLRRDVHVLVASDPKWPFSATYGDGDLTFNFGRLGYKWFAGPLEPILSLIIHEFGHEYESDHFSRGYFRALTDLGARCTALALDRPEFFEAFLSAQGVTA